MPVLLQSWVTAARKLFEIELADGVRPRTVLTCMILLMSAVATVKRDEWRDLHLK